MPADLLSAIITLLAIILYFFMGIRVAQMREKHGIKAPATSGHEEFDRAFRVQMNTLEALPVFLPLLWLATYYFHSFTWLPAALGLVWVVGRVLYMNGYMADPDKRGAGFGIATTAQLGLLIVAIIGIVQSWPDA
ncbi:MAG: MAPEG family protein [Alphaproteobacteria bacterium]|nr:MAPEG family protein [Alphaproteobacteria bacterium]MDE2110635.1 MAPEG family protein [Alphaproteobacteria bacterium]MDE2495064.1 MAPEG family protein [Alphaproteobacteria bacterium]